MKTTFYPLALVSFLLLSSCSKDEPRLSVAAGEYRSGSTLIASGPIMLYTSAGSVSDPAIISRFINHKSPMPGFPPFAAQDIPSNVATNLTIQADKEVRIGESYMGQGTYISYADITTQESHYLVLTQRDSTFLFMAPTGRCGRFANDLLTVRPFQRCYDKLNTTGGTLQSCVYRPQRIIKEVNGQLFIPHLSWWLQLGNCTSSNSGDWNLFNQNVLKQLVPGDTIMVQERQLELIKQ